MSSQPSPRYMRAMQRLADTKLPVGYEIHASGDTLAPFEVIASDGRTVCIAETRRDAYEIAQADERERTS